MSPTVTTPGLIQDLLDSIPAIVWSADATTFAFTYVSPGAVQILGYPVDRWLESPAFWCEHIHPDDRYVIDLCHSNTRDLRDHELVYRMIAADGRTVWLRDQVRVRHGPGGEPELTGVMFDITAEREALDALTRSEENYRLLVDTSPDAIGVHVNGTYVYVNPRFVQLFGGADESDLIGRDVMSLVHPDYEEVVRARHALLAERQAVPMIRERLVALDGRQIDADVMAVPIVFNGIPAVHVVMRDIAERVHAEERLQLLAAGTNEAIWEADLASNALWTNDQYRSLFGSAPDFETAQRMWVESLHPEDREGVASRARHRIENAVPRWSEEYRVRLSSGRWAWVLDRGRVLTDQGGRAVRMIGALLDVTSLRRAEHELVQSEGRYRQIVEEVQDVIYILDTAGNITALNPAFERLTGYKVQDWIGRSIGELLLPDSVEPASAHLEAILNGDLSGPARQYEMRSASGAVLQIEASGQQRVVDGRVAGTIGVVRDVTERNLLERKLEDAKRMASLGQLAASIAHEFNNVLMSIQPFAELLFRTSTSSEHSETARKHISEAVARGKRITGEILLYANPKEPHLQVISATAWSAALSTSLRAMLPETIEVTFDCGRDFRIVADQYQLEQVVANLATNARDAMPGGGTLALELQPDGNLWRKRAALDPARDYARLTARDTGCGISESVLPSIFEPLFTTKRHGTGLGLPIAKRLIEAQNGTIIVESESGRGTAFHLFVPLVSDGSKPN
jgi:PAS domain S-box-containing protein